MKRKEAGFAALLAVVLAMVLVLVSLPIGTVGSSTSAVSGTVTTTTVSSCGAPTAFINGTIGAPNCLELAVSADSQIYFGQSLHVSIDVYNTLPEVNDVTDVNSTADWQFGGFPVFIWSPCWYSWPVQFILVQGNYTEAQLIASDPPTQWGGATCAEGGSVYGVTFQPASDMATVTGGDCTYSCSKILPPSTIEIHANLNFTGYYNASELTGSAALDAFPNLNNSTVPAGQTPFVFGAYTLAVETEWGQVKLFHFMVS
jgi:hypothetical protein